ncbi:unnamed protein product [Oppiella nova]|uniref:Ras-related protein Rab-10 n=1 Tax=Oppiella nova TaxID=334625 RepID=A0A7R9MVS1_9ACAR|nr:unnamed protein product [Oppiella nova]CAG2184131.1 unnamed protein product [Oppiella nova]
MLVYDITNPKSFDNIAKWLRNIDEPLSHNLFISCVVKHANEDVEKMILGNKCDMDDKRMITRERGETIAREHNIRFLETSAKANINIDRAFLELAEAILNKQTAGQNPSESADRVNVSRQDTKVGSKCCNL